MIDNREFIYKDLYGMGCTLYPSNELIQQVEHEIIKSHQYELKKTYTNSLVFAYSVDFSDFKEGIFQYLTFYLSKLYNLIDYIELEYRHDNPLPDIKKEPSLQNAIEKLTNLFNKLSVRYVELGYYDSYYHIEFDGEIKTRALFLINDFSKLYGFSELFEISEIEILNLNETELGADDEVLHSDFNKIPKIIDILLALYNLIEHGRRYEPSDSIIERVTAND